MMNTSNPIFFIFDALKMAAIALKQHSFWGVDLLMWFFTFIMVSMVISVFWRGARG